MKEVNTPKEKWGPANTEHRGDRYKIPDILNYETELEPKKSEYDIEFTPDELEKTSNGVSVPVGTENNGFVHD